MTSAASRVRLAAGGALWAVVIVVAAPASGQPAIDEAIALYAAAAYDEALNALERVPAPELSGAERDTADRYRMLCLLALGRTADAELVIAELLERSPGARLDPDVSPRARRAFDDTRRRVLPALARRHYQRARALYDEHRYEEAAEGFALARSLAADPELSPAEPGLADLAELAAGFEELSRRAPAVERSSAPAAAGAWPPAAAPRSAAPAAAATDRSRERASASPDTPGVPAGGSGAAPRVRPSDALYSDADTGVLAPIQIRREIRWLGRRRPAPATLLGIVEVEIDKNGRVVNAAIRKSVSREFDAVVLDSVKVWEFRPAIRAGLTVRYKKVIEVRSGT
jgi:TonB family protein